MEAVGTAAAWLGIAVLAAGPPALLRRLGARRRWVLLGVLSWGLALALKIAALAALYTPEGAPRLPVTAAALLHGLLSAAAELGLAALFLRRARLSLPDALAFGAAIGSFEVLWVLLEGLLSLADAGELTRATALGLASGPLLLERGLTLVGHAASRLLVYAALASRNALPAALALALFTLADGAAVYGGLAGWNWEEPAVHARFTVFLASLAAVETAAARKFGRAVAWEPPRKPLAAPPGR